MLTLASWLCAGVLRWIRWNVFRQRPTVLLPRLVDAFGLSLGGEVRQNSGGYLVRDDRPQLTTAAPTAAAPPPELTSP